MHVVVQWLNHIQLLGTTWTATLQASLSFTISQSLLKLLCPLSQWCHPTILSSVTPFFCPQSFPASEYFSLCQLFTTGDQSIGASASASVLQWIFRVDFPLGLTGLVSLLSKGFSRVFSSTIIWKHQKQEVHTLNLIWFKCSFFHYWESKHLYNIQP